jgi:hypothetical protein
LVFDENVRPFAARPRTSSGHSVWSRPNPVLTHMPAIFKRSRGDRLHHVVEKPRRTNLGNQMRREERRGECGAIKQAPGTGPDKRIPSVEPIRRVAS